MVDIDGYPIFTYSERTLCLFQALFQKIKSDQNTSVLPLFPHFILFGLPRTLIGREHNLEKEDLVELRGFALTLAIMIPTCF